MAVFLYNRKIKTVPAALNGRSSEENDKDNIIIFRARCSNGIYNNNNNNNISNNDVMNLCAYIILYYNMRIIRIQHADNTCKL